MIFTLLIWIISMIIGLGVIAWMIGLRYIPHNKVGIIEKLWSAKGSLTEGKLIALEEEAGFQADVLRGGLHLTYSPLKYRIHMMPLVIIAEGRIGYIYARDGEPLTPIQTLGKVVDCDNFQNAIKFLRNGGQRGRQRAILREGVYAINLAQFVVITEDLIYTGPIQEKDGGKYLRWQEELNNIHGFNPVVIGSGGSAEDTRGPEKKDNLVLNPRDNIGIITVHDGPPLETDEIIAPEIQTADTKNSHHCFQDPEKFLELGGRRGKQLQVLTDGTYFINRWFATVEKSPKTLIPIGYVGVVVSYYGVTGQDVTGETFRYGEQVEPGHRGIWKQALRPGKYALNPYAVTVELVPTTNFVLRWITGQTEEHQYDKELTSIALITADGYEPTLPLSLILHIDYEKAPRVVQRFGNIHRLISQTLDPILSAYFRDVAQNTNMLDLLTRREEIQKKATDELSRRFREYDINCVAVLIGRPESKDGKMGEDPIEKLFDQLRTRRAAEEQLVTYDKQEQAAKKLRELKDAQATAEKQSELTQSKINVDITANKGDAMVAEAKRMAEREVALADGSARSKELMGRGEGRGRELQGKGEAARINDIGMAEAAVFAKKVQAYGDPRLFALLGVTEQLSGFTQPLVPERVMVMNSGQDGKGKDTGITGLFNQLLALMVSEKFGVNDTTAQPETTPPTDNMDLDKK